MSSRRSSRFNRFAHDRDSNFRSGSNFSSASDYSDGADNEFSSVEQDSLDYRRNLGAASPPRGSPPRHTGLYGNPPPLDAYVSPRTRRSHRFADDANLPRRPSRSRSPIQRVRQHEVDSFGYYRHSGHSRHSPEGVNRSFVSRGTSFDSSRHVYEYDHELAGPSSRPPIFPVSPIRFAEPTPRLRQTIITDDRGVRRSVYVEDNSSSPAINEVPRHVHRSRSPLDNRRGTDFDQSRFGSRSRAFDRRGTGFDSSRLGPRQGDTYRGGDSRIYPDNRRGDLDRGTGSGPSRLDSAFAEMDQFIRSGDDNNREEELSIIDEWPAPDRNRRRQYQESPHTSSLNSSVATSSNASNSNVTNSNAANVLSLPTPSTAVTAAATVAAVLEGLSVPVPICDEITRLLTSGISTDLSKAASKEFPLKFEAADCHLKPPALDPWVQRRATEKNKWSAVKSNDTCLTTIQLKIMDSLPPVIDLYTRCLSLVDDANRNDGDAVRLRRSLQAALQQITRSFAYVSQVRRESAMDLMDPELMYLLKEKDATPQGPEARKLLFTDSFLQRRLTEARNDNDIAKSDKKLAEAAANRKKKDSRKKWADKPKRWSNFSKKRGGFEHRKGGGGFFRDKKSKGGGSKRRYVVVSPSCSILPPVSVLPPPAVPAPADPVAKVGARLRDFADNWVSITDDQWVLSTVRNGLLIDFVSQPSQDRLPRDVVMSEREQSICDAEVAAMIDKGAIKEVTDGSKGFVSSFFCVPKKVEGDRPIANMKGLNACIRYEHFKMESLDSVRYLIQQGDWLVKLDLKDAYFVVGVHPSHKKYMRFFWRGRIFEFCCMAFGLAPAPAYLQNF